MDSLKVKLSFPSYILEDRGLVKLVRLSGEYLALSTLWRSLAEKLDVYGIMELFPYIFFLCP